MASGFGFKQLLGEADENTLRLLIRPEALDLLKALDPALLDLDSIRTFVYESRTSRSYLTDPEARRILLRLLPREKARELCRALDIPNVDDPHAALEQIELPRGGASEDIVLTFFGAKGGVATLQLAPSIEFVSSEYPLFPHQRKAAREVLAKLNTPPRRLVLHMPTGGGKTRTTMHVIATHLREHEPTVVIWLAYSRELLEQAASEFTKAWSLLGNRDLAIYRFWGPSTANPQDLRDGLLVAGLDKLYAWWQRDINALPTLADRTTLTVMDEAHQSIAKTYSEMLDLLASKRADSQLLGLTATPGRTWADIEEDARLADFFGANKVELDTDGYRSPVTYLIEKGYLARPTFRTLNATAGLKLSDGDVRKLARELDISNEMLDLLASSTARNLKIVSELEALMTRHRRVLFFATNVGQAELIAAVLRARGHDAGVVTSGTPQHERQGTLQRYVANGPAPMTLCNYGVLTTGFDAPRTSAVLISRPTRSLVLFSQMVGRAIRGPLAGGNDEAEIVTVIDPELPGFGDVAEAFENWEDVWQRPQ